MPETVKLSHTEMAAWTYDYCLEVAAGVLRDVAKREPARSAEQLRYLADRIERRVPSNQDRDPASEPEECHICHQPTNAPGELWCSYPHPLSAEQKAYLKAAKDEDSNQESSHS